MNSNSNIKRSNSRSNGFTMIEVIIVVAIIGLLAAIGIPNYNKHMLKSRRVDGVSFLTEAASEQIRFYSEYNRFATTSTELGYGDSGVATSNEGFYTLSIVTEERAQTHTLTVTPVADGPQNSDTVCAAMTLNSTGQKTVSGTGTPADCW